MPTRWDQSPDTHRDAAAAACAAVGDDRHRLLDVLLGVQRGCGWIPPAAIAVIAGRLGLTPLAVRGVASFYSFLSLEPKGRIVIRLCDDIIDRHAGFEQVRAAFEDALGIRLGQATADGAISLEQTPCIGLCDQAPAAMVNDIVLTALTPEKARKAARALLAGAPPQHLVSPHFDSLPPYDRARAAVANNIRLAGDVLLGEAPREAGLARTCAMAPGEIIATVTASGLRGCGGAGFPAGRKWQAAAHTAAERRFIICNADEGEPGTFKDRVLLTERPHLLFEGMAIAARAIGASDGILYLRGEYVYLRDHLEAVLAERRAGGLLGPSIMGVDGFDLDIRIQLGAGAYVCGEEGALISSCEGLRGEPKTRPPFPVERGYLGFPTVVNNVETLCHAARILDRGAAWFAAMGTPGSHGTKLFSVSGDCAAPGIYELPYGISLRELLALAGGEDAAAVQVGGPSGVMVGRDSFDRRLDFDDLATGGAIIVFNGSRNILDIVDYYLSFFVHESCGYCTPCRVGNLFLRQAIAKFRKGHAGPDDVDQLRTLSATIIETSRCGLGTTSPNPVLSTLANFPLVYSAITRPAGDGLEAGFDIQSAIEEARGIARRRSFVYDRDFSQ